MQTEPLERTDEHQSGETPEDVAILYSWANLQGAKYRDFSANRREYRAQMRHRAAEQLRLMELRAQSEAEAAAAEAEAEAAAAHAEADAATVKLAVSRSMPALAPEEILMEKEVEEHRKSSLREAAQQARRAASERLEAARRAEAAALADSIARREEREIAEAQASALRQAAQYHDSELRSRQMMAQHPGSEDQVPGRISDPYSPQLLAEGEYYDGPGTPPSELEASRFRTQREYIERSTGSELPKFKMPPLFDEGPLPLRARQESDHDLRREPQGFDLGNAPRRLSEMDLADREYYADRHLREERNASIPPKQWPGRHEHEAVQDDLDRNVRGPQADAPMPKRAEVVSQIPQAVSLPVSDRRRDGDDAGPSRTPRGAGYNGSLLNEEFEVPRRPRGEFATEADRPERDRLERKPDAMNDAEWRPRRSGVPPAVREAQLADDQRRNENGTPQLYSATPRASGSWLRQISARDDEADRRRGPSIAAASPPERHVDAPTSRPSVEATYAEVLQEGASAQTDRQPSGFRPPWLTQAQAPRPSGARRTSEAPAAERATPQWLYPPPPQATEDEQVEPIAFRTATARNAARNLQETDVRLEAADHAHTAVASRWFAVKGVFARTDAAELPDRSAPREKNATPLIAVYSLAGGVGKTSLVATLGRALSSLGEKVLLADTTSHGLLPFYFGANDLTSGVVRTFTPPRGSVDAPVHMVSYDLDRQASDAHAQTAIFDGLMANSQQVNRVLLDLNGNCGWLVERLVRLKPTVLVPVVADMNSIISLQAVEKRFASMQNADGQPLRPVYLLNQFDATLPLHVDLREVLRQQLGDRLLPFVIRRSAGISEALAEGMTIVDYDPDSSAVQDFVGLANWVRASSAPVQAGLRSMRWSER